MAVPNTAPVSAGFPLLGGVLELQIASGHELLFFDSAFFERFDLVLNVVFVDDDDAKSFGQLFFQGLVEFVRVAVGNQPHLLGQGKVEIGDFSPGTRAGVVEDAKIFYAMLEGVLPINLVKGVVICFIGSCPSWALE